MDRKFHDVEISSEKKNPFSKKLLRAILYSLFTLSFISCAASLKSQKKALDTGLRLYKNGEYAKSAGEFEKFLSQYKKSRLFEKTYFFAGKSYFQLDNYKKALYFYNKLITEFPFGEYRSLAEYERCNVFFKAGKFKLARKNLESFIEKGREKLMGEAHILLGRCHLEEKLYNQALMKFKEAFQFFDNKGKRMLLHLYLAKCYFSLNDIKSLKKELTYLEKSNDGNIICEKLKLELELAKLQKKLLGQMEKLLEMKEFCEFEKGKKETEEKIKELIDPITDREHLQQIIEKFTPHFPADYSELKLIRLSMDRGNLVDAVLRLRNFNKNYPESPYQNEADKLIEEVAPQNGVFPNKIGCILPLSGQYEVFGKNVLLGVKLAVKVFNEIKKGSKIVLVIKDNEGSPERTKQCLEELAVGEGVVAVIGPVLSVNAKAILEASEAFQVPVFSPTASAPDLSGKSRYFLRNCITISQQLKQLLEFAYQRLALKTFILYYPENKYGYMVLKFFEEILGSLKDITHFEFIYSPASTDFKDQILPLAEIENRPLAIVIPDSANVASMIASQIAFYGIKDYQLLGTNNWNSTELFNSGKLFVQGGIFCNNFDKEDNNPAVKYFCSRFKEEYELEPDYLQAQAYDTTIMIMQKINSGVKSRILMNEQLHKITNFHGVSGITTMKSNGEAIKKVNFFKVEGNKFINMHID